MRSLRQPSGDFAHRPAQIPIQRFENVLQRAKHESAKHLAVAGRLFRARQAEKLRRSSRDASLGRSPGLVWCPRAAIVSMHSERTRRGYQLPAELGVRECAYQPACCLPLTGRHGAQQRGHHVRQNAVKMARNPVLARKTALATHACGRASPLRAPLLPPWV